MQIRIGMPTQASSEGWTKKRLDKRLTYAQVKPAENLRDLLNEVVSEMCDAAIPSLVLETKLRITERNSNL